MKRIGKSEADGILNSMMIDFENITRKYDIELDDEIKVMLEKQAWNEIEISFDVDC